MRASWVLQVVTYHPHVAACAPRADRAPCIVSRGVLPQLCLTRANSCVLCPQIERVQAQRVILERGVYGGRTVSREIVGAACPREAGVVAPLLESLAAKFDNVETGECLYI